MKKLKKILKTIKVLPRLVWLIIKVTRTKRKMNKIERQYMSRLNIELKKELEDTEKEKDGELSVEDIDKIFIKYANKRKELKSPKTDVSSVQKSDETKV